VLVSNRFPFVIARRGSKNARESQTSAWSRSIVLFFLSVFAGLLSTSANAGTFYFAIPYTGSGIASAGILTTSDVLVGGAYTITDIQGSRSVNDIGGQAER